MKRKFGTFTAGNVKLPIAALAGLGHRALDIFEDSVERQIMANRILAEIDGKSKDKEHMLVSYLPCGIVLMLPEPFKSHGQLGIDLLQRQALLGIPIYRKLDKHGKGDAGLLSVRRIGKRPESGLCTWAQI